jgi:hypothetical protein
MMVAQDVIADAMLPHGERRVRRGAIRARIVTA